MLTETSTFLFLLLVCKNFLLQICIILKGYRFLRCNFVKVGTFFQKVIKIRFTKRIRLSGFDKRHYMVQSQRMGMESGGPPLFIANCFCTGVAHIVRGLSQHSVDKQLFSIT